MDLVELTRRAVAVRARFSADATVQGRAPWSRAELAQGFVGDVGALMKLVMAKEGRRAGPPDLDAKLAHELADCLWSVLVLADAYAVDLERAFGETMDGVERKLAASPDSAASRCEKELSRNT
jgi:NTP pyrophosphatase (non-canonical NTP hydrolase)